MADLETFTWEEFGSAARELAAQVWESGYRPDIIVSIARGGLIPAGAIAYALDMKDMVVLNVEFYSSVGHTLPDPRLLAPIPDFKALQHKKVLMVDDVADSGRTLQFVKDLCEHAGASEVRTAVIYQKPVSVIDCDYIWHRTARWIAFPWSCQAPVNAETNSEA